MHNDWISVKDKLPQYTDTYLVTVTIGTMLGSFTEVRAMRYNKRKGNGEWVLDEALDETLTVIAWQDLPEPYEEKQINK